MIAQNDTKYCPAFSTLLNFMSVKICNGGQHTQKSWCACKRHQMPLHNCQLCKAASKKLTYHYQCADCKQFLCLAHFIDHVQIFKFCKTNRLKVSCSTSSFTIKDACMNALLLPYLHKMAINLVSSAIELIVSVTDVETKGSIFAQFMKAPNIHSFSK